jgi:predicted enzyme related to lactoylglutathione lyase
MPDPMFILFVKDQGSSREFYRAVLQMDPSLDVEGMTMFNIDDKMSIGLMPADNIHSVLDSMIPNPTTGDGIPRCEIYLFVENPEERLQKIEAAGGKKISYLKKRSWGDEVAYGLDPDGHIIALAKLSNSSG